MLKVLEEMDSQRYPDIRAAMEQTGTLIGDVATASLVVEDGGCLNGRSTMTKAPDPEAELQDVQPVGDLQFGPDYPMEGE